MPTLPTLTVTQTVADRLLAAFADQTDEDGVALTPVQAYKRWLRSSLTQHVISQERYNAAEDLEIEIPVT